MFVDVHTHLTHEKFKPDLEEVIKRATEAQVTMVVNGLEPESNRQILEMSSKHSNILPALGIYPIEAINDIVEDLPFPIKKFDVQDEIDFIKAQAQQKKIVAVGECGLDGHWVDESTFAKQEAVFLQLAEIALDHHLPLIIHTRKLEKRSMELLEHHGIKKVNFHCYGGKSKMAIQAAEKHGWYFSIPANARKNQSFTKLLKSLPTECILTETDAPYLGPERGVRNEPANVVGTVEYFAELRSISKKEAQNIIWANFQKLFFDS